MKSPTWLVCNSFSGEFYRIISQSSSQLKKLNWLVPSWGPLHCKFRGYLHACQESFRKWGQDVSAGVNFLNFLLAASKESWNGWTRSGGSIHFMLQGQAYYMHVYARISQLLRNDQVAQWVMHSHI